MNVQPLRDFVVVTKEEGPKTTASGLHLPTTAAEDKIANGTIVAVGSGRLALDGTIVPLEVKVGDRVAFNRNMATEVKVNGETAHLLREDQILCIIK